MKNVLNDVQSEDLCANDFARLRGADRPKVLTVVNGDVIPKLRSLHDWLLRNPLYPTLVSFETGLKMFAVYPMDPDNKDFMTFSQIIMGCNERCSIGVNNGQPIEPGEIVDFHLGGL